MKFLHTSDWHLGRSLHGQSLLDDQAHILDQVVGLVQKGKPDAVIIAGDVYDRSVPPHSAVKLLDDVLSRIIIELSTPVVMIAGNHDSPDRLAFGSSIFRDQGLFIFGGLEDSLNPVEFTDTHGKVQVFGLPFAEPSLVREFLKRDDLHTHDEAINALVGAITERTDPAARTVLISHAFVTGSLVSESERPLSIGGAETVSSDHFGTFNYTALGHLHRSQKAGHGSIRYSGSILKYSFSEATDAKAVLMVTMDGKGTCRVRSKPLKPRRDLRSITGLFDDILKSGEQDSRPDDYIRLILEDKEPIFEAMAKIREVYPNTLQIERRSLGATGKTRRLKNVRKKTDLQLFKSFFKDLAGEAPTKEECAVFSDVIDDLDKSEREVAS